MGRQVREQLSMSLLSQGGHILNFDTVCTVFWSFPSDSAVKNLSAMQETLVQSLGQEDPLEKQMATHSSIPAWRIPWTEEPDGLQSMVLQRVGHD